MLPYPEDMWESKAADGTCLSGFRGSDMHVHECGLGTGVVTVQSSGEHEPFNTFNRDVDEMLPPEWRLK